jgi:ABC-type nitrate/sulfonate/bicarbonate transport system permease component
MLAWEASTRFGIVPQSRLPLLSDVIYTLLGLISNYDFLGRVLQSFLNLTLGIFLAVAVALPLSLLAGLKGRIDLALTPLIMLLGALPDLALLPVMVVWIGPGNLAAIAMASICAFFPVYFTVREGMKDIPRDLFYVAHVFGSGRLAKLRKVIMPAISPHLFTGLRLSFDFVWEVVLAIEMIARVTGIGTLIESSISSGSVEVAFAGIVAVGIIAITIDRVIFGLLEDWLRRWIE